MIAMQAAKLVQLVNPGAVKNNASFTSLVVDCAGWDYATLVFSLGTTDIAMAALRVQESDNNSSWTDVSASNFADATQLNWAGAALGLPAAGDGGAIEVVHLDMRKRKRYLKCVATAGAGTNGTYMSALAVLSRAKIGASTAASEGTSQTVVA